MFLQRKSPTSPETKKEVKINGNNSGSTLSSPKSDAGKVDVPKLDKVSMLFMLYL